MAGNTYSFLDTHATLVGPGGLIDLGAGAGIAEEGISIEPSADKNVMTIGADGTGMHSARADKSGTLTIRLLKTSPTNARLMALYDLQQLNGQLWGNNAITLTHTGSGDSISCRGVAFKKKPTLTYATEGQLNEWAFDVIAIDSLLGTF